MTHDLKLRRDYFDAVADGTKPFELRQEDTRTFAVGDVLVLHEVIPTDLGCSYTGRTLTREVTYVLRDPEHRWLQPGVVALSLRAVEA